MCSDPFYFDEVQSKIISRIHAFFVFIRETPIELHSESGLQHELALYLRTTYKDLNVWLEYPTSKIFNPLPQFIKKEIDIYIKTQQGHRYVIELKMPKDDCGTPNEMYRAIEDVKFLEQLRQNNIDGCYSILMTSSEAFWNARRAKERIYQFFNGDSVNLQTIDLADLPVFLQKRGPITLKSVYQGAWQDYDDANDTQWKYYVINI